MAKSSLFRDKGRVGKGDWRRKCDNAKVAETLGRVFADHVPTPGKRTFKYVNGELVEVKHG